VLFRSRRRDGELLRLAVCTGLAFPRTDIRRPCSLRKHRITYSTVRYRSGPVPA
jgi:hypothetical protein